MKKGITIYSAAQLFARGELTVKSFIEYSAKLGFEGVDLGYFWQDKEIRCPHLISNPVDRYVSNQYH